MSEPRAEMTSRVLEAAGAGVPVSARPFAELATRLRLGEDEVLQALRQARDDRSLRRFGARLVPSRLGYHATLGALAVPEDRIDDVAAMLAALPNVTHVFGFEDRYPLWYALVTSSRTRLEIAESEIARAAGVQDRYRVLPDELYKATVTFDAAGVPGPCNTGEEASSPPALDRDERALVRLLQGELPLTTRPFAELAHTLGECGYDVDERWALERAAALGATGALEGVAATLRSREEPWRLALAVWRCPADPTVAGARIASFPEVLHCFQRRVPGGMAILSVVETPSRGDLDRTIGRIRVAAELEPPRIAYPLREHARAGLRYFTEGD